MPPTHRESEDGDQDRAEVRREEGLQVPRRQAHLLERDRPRDDPRDREGHLRQPLPPHARGRLRDLPRRAQGGEGRDARGRVAPPPTTPTAAGRTDRRLRLLHPYPLLDLRRALRMRTAFVQT